MPAYAEVKLDQATEMQAMAAIVESDSSTMPTQFAEVLFVEESVGMKPGRAVISIRNANAADETGPITLNDIEGLSPRNLKYWSRIRVTTRSKCCFIGNLVKRRDALDPNAVVLEYWDDRIMLGGVPLRGAWVYDSYSGSAGVKFLEGVDPNVNPWGRKNCTRINNDLYVFMSPTEAGTATICDDNKVGNEESAPGVCIFWTPERWLKYLKYVCTVAAPVNANGGGTSLYLNAWCKLDITRLLWPTPSFQDGTMRRAMPSKNFRGYKVLRALKEGLDITGEYGFEVDYSSGQQGTLTFSIRDKGVATNAGTKKIVYLQRAGVAADIKTIFDGVQETDASELCTGNLYAGDRFKIESEWRYTNEKIANDALTLGWSTTLGTSFHEEFTEETNFLRMAGGCFYPNTDAINTNFSAHSLAALQWARQAFPRPFKCFKLDGVYAGTIMGGFGGNLLKYPIKLDFRVPLHEQLQPFFEDTGVQRGRMRIPIRVQVSDNTVADAYGAAKFHDVTFNNGLKISGDGMIWFDGLTDDLAGIDNIYDRSIRAYDPNNDATTRPRMRYIKINMAAAHDARLWASFDIFKDGADYNNIRDEIDESLNGADGPFLQHYTLNPEGFQQEHQFQSSPVAAGSFATSNGASPPVLAQIAEPVPDKIIYNSATQIIGASARVQKDVASFKRTGTWRFPGIRLDLQAGDFIDEIQMMNGAGSAGRSWKLDSPLATVRRDFAKQETAVTTE